jgi:hypothetical protein
MISPLRPRSEVLAAMPDVRRHPGTRHPLAAILALVWSALLCGYRSYPALAAWRGTSRTRLTPALGVPPPAALCSTLHMVLRGVEREALEAKRGAWAEGLLPATPASQDAVAGLAIPVWSQSGRMRRVCWPWYAATGLSKTRRLGGGM